MTIKDRKRLMADTATILGMVILAAGMCWMLVVIKVDKARVDALSAGLEQEQDAARNRGDEPVAPAPSDLIDDPGKTEKPKEGKTGPTDNDVARMVKAAVADYLSGVDFDKDDRITEADIIATVSNYLSDHGIEAFDDKKLAEMVGDEVTKQLQALGDLTGPKGDKGDKGEKGDKGDAGTAPTPEEIGKAVKAYIESQGLPVCPSGYKAQTLDVLTTTGSVDSIICVRV